jgi:hypothetical protein
LTFLGIEKMVKEEIKEKLFFRGIELGRSDRNNGKEFEGHIRKISYVHQRIFLQGYNIGYYWKDYIKGLV